MVKGLYTAYTGMIIEQKKMDRLTNNLANADTNGFKKEGLTATSFADQLAYRIKDTSSALIPRGIGDITFGAKVGETYIDWSIGSFDVTDNMHDFAIEGNGFFRISYTDKQGQTSVKYTRDGAFAVDRDGVFRTKDGDYVLNQAGGRITIDPNQPFSIDGQRNIIQNGQIVGNIGVVDIADYNFLQEFGENMYDLVEGGQEVATDTAVIQGALEKSNMNVVDEMVEMITVSRAYEANQKVIQAVDGTIEKAVTQVGKVG
jgi:flagellar basal-body rod protein FlgG